MSAAYFDAVLRDEENLLMAVEGVFRGWSIRTTDEGLQLDLTEHDRPTSGQLYALASDADRRTVLEAHRQAVKKGLEWDSL